MNQKFIIFSIFSLVLVGFATCSYAVEDNVTIEGNLDPTNRSEEVYVVRVTPSNEHRDITFSIYGSGEIIVSKTSYIKAGSSYENFFVKFFPPLFEDGKKYTIQVLGPGLIGRDVITIKEEFRSYDSEPVVPVLSDEEIRLEKEQERLEKEQELRKQERLEKEQSPLMPQVPSNPQIPTPKTQCGEGTVLQDGICTVAPVIPSNENNEEPPYSLIGLVIFVMMIIVPVAIKKSRKKKAKEIVIKKEVDREKEFEKQKAVWKAKEEENRIEDQKIEEQRKKKLKEKKQVDDEFEKQKQLWIESEAKKAKQKIIEDEKKRVDDEKKKLAKKKREEDKEKQTETYDQTISRLTKEPYRYQMNDEEKETEKMFKDLGKNTLETNTENKPMASGTGSPCKGICIDFKTKKPSTGGRYEFGQARCQTCEIWTDYRGAKLKSGEPAPEGSLGWYCVCCNIRLRQKPRGKEYKDRLTKVLDDSNIPHGIEINNWIEDSMILIKSRKNGILQSEIQKILSISNKDMRELVPRITRIENIVINDVDDPNSQSYSVEKKFKFVVTKYDITASQIAKFVESRELSNPQPYTSVLEKFRKFSEGFKDESFEDILSRFIIGKSENSSKNQKSIINNFIKYTFEQTPESITVEKKESDRDKKKESDRDKKIKIMVQVMIKEYIRDKYSRNKQLKQRLTIEFVKGASISEICKSNPEYSKNEILNHIITDKRLPAELKEMENEQYFDSDKEISLAIPLFAVDYYQWEGAKKDEQKVIDLAVEIKECLTNNPKLRETFGK